MDSVLIVGSSGVRGGYVLRIGVRDAMNVTFGRFRRGEPIRVAAGEYVYVGSALGRSGSSSLPHRLIRHATRTNGRPAQAIREALVGRLHEAGMLAESCSLPTAKRLHWNVDHLLDRGEAEIAGVVAVRTPHDVEGRIASWLGTTKGFVPLARGLGAHDRPGETHLFRIAGGDVPWGSLVAFLRSLV